MYREEIDATQVPILKISHGESQHRLAAGPPVATPLPRSSSMKLRIEKR
jgi:hypothetical protein